MLCKNSDMKITFHSSAIIALIGTPTKAKAWLELQLQILAYLPYDFCIFVPFIKLVSPWRLYSVPNGYLNPTCYPWFFYTWPDPILKIIGKRVTQNIGYFPMFQVNPKFKALPNTSCISRHVWVFQVFHSIIFESRPPKIVICPEITRNTWKYPVIPRNTQQ